MKRYCIGMLLLSYACIGTAAEEPVVEPEDDFIGVETTGKEDSDVRCLSPVSVTKQASTPEGNQNGSPLAKSHHSRSGSRGDELRTPASTPVALDTKNSTGKNSGSSSTASTPTEQQKDSSLVRRSGSHGNVLTATLEPVALDTKKSSADKHDDLALTRDSIAHVQKASFRQFLARCCSCCSKSGGKEHL